MKIPTNNQIIEFFKKYGLWFIIIIVCLIAIQFTIIGTVKSVRNMSIPDCEMTQAINEDQTIKYNGKVYKYYELDDYSSFISIRFNKQ